MVTGRAESRLGTGLYLHLEAGRVSGLLALIFVAVPRNWTTAVVVAAAAITAVVVTGIVTSPIGRERPPAWLSLVHAGGFSMPSRDGALTSAAALALLLATTWSTRNVRRAVTAGLGIAVVLIGVRVYLGAHWPTDVLAGWAVGALASWAVTATFRGRLGVGPATRPPGVPTSDRKSSREG